MLLHLPLSYCAGGMQQANRRRYIVADGLATFEAVLELTHA
ncbi:hypothetical protein ACFSKU_05730 [Pontibacter silvestris]|uniref:Uncharacterized protein n=1 Tax=Pontibacter silvestris TaxID=2305183 RepID=A0ABW4WUC7_9BACT|nr:hypothetical protein [Pontibacter silvestris]